MSMTNDEEDALYDSCHEEIDGLLVLSNVRIRLAIRAAYARGQEVERERCARVCEELSELNRRSPTDSMWQCEECAAAIREGK